MELLLQGLLFSAALSRALTCFFVQTSAGIPKHKHLMTSFMHMYLSNQNSLFMALANSAILVW